jgi:hypothetical protein
MNKSILSLSILAVITLGLYGCGYKTIILDSTNETKEILLIDIHNIEPDKANTLAYGAIEQGLNQEIEEDTTEEV